MSFDTLAPYYRGLERVMAGGLLQRCRTAFLADTVQCRKALLLGEGPGRFLAELLRANPRVEVTCVEFSPRMIAAARAALEDCELKRVQFVEANALHWPPPPREFDLVVTNFFLDCFCADELALVIANAAAAATPEARWLLTDFREPDHGWRRWRGRVVLALMYAFFRTATGLSASRLTPPDELLEARGFRLAARRLGSFGLIHADLWQRAAS